MIDFDTSAIENEKWLNTLAIKENAIKKDVKLIKNGKSIDLKYFISNISSPKLIVRFSYLGCNVCVDKGV